MMMMILMMIAKYQVGVGWSVCEVRAPVCKGLVDPRTESSELRDAEGRFAAQSAIDNHKGVL
jgi:hypothetical protein